VSSGEAPTAAAVIVAAGAGRRLGGPVRKQYLEVGGVPVLLHALRPFLAHPRIGTVVVVLPPEDLAAPPAWLAETGARLAPGGAERGASVRGGLAALADEAPARVLVHDGARPFADAETIDRVLAGCGGGWGAVPAVPVTDTLKSVDAEGRVTGTPDRARLRRAQTPQGFPYAALVDAYRRAAAEGWSATDDAAVFERGGGAVRVVEGAERNLKVTHPGDLVVAEAIAAARGKRTD
jgi:2-C-methyl-D-erythritol 4-phosphate cytidylyltransferase